MKKIIIACITLTCVLCMVACEEQTVNQKYENEVISYELPDGWSEIETKEGSLYAWHGEETKGDIGIVVKTITDNNTFEKIINDQTIKMEKDNVEVKEEKISVNHKEAKKFIYTGTIAQYESYFVGETKYWDEIPETAYIEKVLLSEGNRVLMFTYSIAEDENLQVREEGRDVFNRFLESIKILN